MKNHHRSKGRFLPSYGGVQFELSGGLLSRLSLAEQYVLALPSTLAATFISLSVLINSLLAPYDSISLRQRDLLVSLSGLFYLILLFFLLIPALKKHAWLAWIIAALNGFGTAILNAIVPPPLAAASLVIVTACVTVSAALAGRWPTYVFILSTALGAFVLPQSDRMLGPLAGIAPWANVWSMPLVSIIITETIVILSSIINAQITRLETVNRVAREITSTIESEQVISMVCAAVRDAFVTDTYYVGLLQQDGQLRMELLYDDGEFFTNQLVKLANSPGGYVIQHGQPLLIHNMIKEIQKLGLEIQLLGKPRTSLSWMGAPIETGGRVIGLMAVASYQRNAYSLRDLGLLQSIAQQAGLAIDNAFIHAQAVEQSHMDSLTQVYNHGYFLVLLAEYTSYYQHTGASFSLIMLDIDHFKGYNDTYGHIMGDRMLVELVKTIQASIRSTDFIGRWGGDEFAILLPEADQQAACQIATRIQTSLAAAMLDDSAGQRVPPPTISQGVAVYPADAEYVEGLVLQADKRLYKAKEHGRNQVNAGS